jgi:conjugal transfer/entry exclusion protein
MSEVPPAAPIQVGSGGSPGGYKFEPGQVDAVLKQWQDLYDELQTDISHALKIEGVTAPGQEFASADFINTGAKVSGHTLLEQHQKMSDYVANYILALQKASGKVEQGEQLATDAVKSRKPRF